eukprot:TRINITY_DN11681_c0_g1_i1.p1 TRINITY_DN11681_c0_g1~~TRINITY_DN11681_c0_g1_i1.p1  ORF type:complete len:314 (+),score=54.61 TRINITY_DN11681_c0_g1_i1:74-1015(+)
MASPFRGDTDSRTDEAAKLLESRGELLESLSRIPALLAEQKVWESEHRVVFSLLRKGLQASLANGSLEAPIYSNSQIEDALVFLVAIGRRYPRRKEHVRTAFKLLRQSKNWCIALRGSLKFHEVLKSLPMEFQEEILSDVEARELLLLMAHPRSKDQVEPVDDVDCGHDASTVVSAAELETSSRQCTPVMSEDEEPAEAVATQQEQISQERQEEQSHRTLKQRSLVSLPLLREATARSRGCDMGRSTLASITSFYIGTPRSTSRSRKRNTSKEGKQKLFRAFQIPADACDDVWMRPGRNTSGSRVPRGSIASF